MFLVSQSVNWLPCGLLFPARQIMGQCRWPTKTLRALFEKEKLQGRSTTPGCAALQHIIGREDDCALTPQWRLWMEMPWGQAGRSVRGRRNAMLWRAKHVWWQSCFHLKRRRHAGTLKLKAADSKQTATAAEHVKCSFHRCTIILLTHSLTIKREKVEEFSKYNWLNQTSSFTGEVWERTEP